MDRATRRRVGFVIALIGSVAGYAWVSLSGASSLPRPPSQQAPARATARSVGTIKAIAGNSITLAPDAAGAEINVVVQAATRILRVAPGQKDLKDAAPIHLQDLQVGDRILVFGSIAADKSLVASSILAQLPQFGE